MICGFQQKFPWGEPTWFREKILAGAGYATTETHPLRQLLNHILEPKIHTIRPGNRWRAGMPIQMAYGVRTKNYQQFNKGIPELEKVVSVQHVKITWVGAKDPETYWPKIEVDGNVIGYTRAMKKIVAGLPIIVTTDKTKVIEFVHNDGFDSITDFCRWFNKDFEGQIIHFTDLRY